MPKTKSQPGIKGFVAAMRGIAAAELVETVEIPEELTQ